MKLKLIKHSDMCLPSPLSFSSHPASEIRPLNDCSGLVILFLEYSLILTKYHGGVMLGYKSSSDNFRKFLVFNWMHMIGKDFNVLIHYDLLIKKIRQYKIIT